jgi:hypothetical protein
VGILRGAGSFNTTVILIGELSSVLKASTNTDLIFRTKAKFAGVNHIHFGEGLENYVTLPIIPEKA